MLVEIVTLLSTFPTLCRTLVATSAIPARRADSNRPRWATSSCCWACLRADVINVLTPAFRENLLQRGLVPPGKIVFVEPTRSAAPPTIVGTNGDIVSKTLPEAARVASFGVSAGVTPDELKRHCQGQIAHFKIPQYIMIVQSLPRTVTGKIRKHVLRENAIAELGLAEAARIETA